MTALSIRAFAKLAGVSKTAVDKARRVGRLPRVLDLGHPDCRAFLELHGREGTAETAEVVGLPADGDSGDLDVMSRAQLETIRKVAYVEHLKLKNEAKRSGLIDAGLVRKFIEKTDEEHERFLCYGPSLIAEKISEISREGGSLEACIEVTRDIISNFLKEWKKTLTRTLRNYYS
jgi:hypothetical protein